MITDELLPYLQGALPAQLVTATKEGVPNITIVSQVFMVDEHHVAISNQFMNKTLKNLKENPRAEVQVLNPTTIDTVMLQVQFIREETEGALFDELSIQLEAIAAMSGLEDLFKLKGALIFKVISVEKKMYWEN